MLNSSVNTAQINMIGESKAIMFARRLSIHIWIFNKMKMWINNYTCPTIWGILTFILQVTRIGIVVHYRTFHFDYVKLFQPATLELRGGFSRGGYGMGFSYPGLNTSVLLLISVRWSLPEELLLSVTHHLSSTICWHCYFITPEAQYHIWYSNNDPIVTQISILFM